MYRSNIYPKLILLVSFMVLGFSSAFAQLELKLQLIDDDTWGVYVRPDGSITPSTNTITGSGQVTIVMPAGFTWSGLTSVSGQWLNNATVVSPPEDVARQYVSFGLQAAEPTYPIVYQDGVETLLFTIDRDEPCPDTMYLIDCGTPSESDPFCPNNSANSNPGNDLSVIDFDAGPAFYNYSDNYALSAWSCEDCDGDGILNGLEDTNGNGVFDVGVDTSDICDPCDPIHVETADLNFVDGFDALCAGDAADTAYLTVTIEGGWTPYQVILDNGSTLDTFNNYYSGDTIAVVPTASTVYTLETVIDSFSCEIDPDSLTGSIAIQVEGPLSFSADPVDVTECDANGTSFCATAVNGGDGTILYNWQVSTDNGTTFIDLEDGYPYDSTANNCLYIDDVAGLDNYLYRVKIWTATCDTVFSNSARLDVEGPITATLDPSDYIVCDAGSATFTAAGANAGDGGVTYLWQYNDGSGWTDMTEGGVYGGSTHTNVTTGTVSLANVDVSMDGWQYRMAIYSSTCARVFTAAATLDIEGPLSFSDHPDDVSNCAGAEVFFNFVYDNPGLGTVTYQWQANDGSGWANISNGTVYNNTNGIKVGASNGDTLAITNVVGLDGYQYRVCITTPTCGSVCSNAATLDVSGNVAFTQQPPADPIPVCAGSDTTIVACASIPQGTFYYSWEYSTDDGATWDSLAIGANANLSHSSNGASMASGCDTLIISDVASFTGYWFRAVAQANDCSGVTSEEARLLVEGPLSVVTDPVAQTECSGNAVQFSAEIANGGDADAVILYQWQVSTDNGTSWTNLNNNSIYSGVTTPLMLISDIAGMNTFCFRMSAGTSTCNDIYTAQACLTVEGPVTVTDQPDDVTLCYDDIATFTSTANVGAAGTLSYQWQLSSDGGVNWNPIGAGTDGGVYSGYNSTTLTVNDVTGLYSRSYRMAFSTGTCTAVYSDPAEINIQGPVAITDEPDDITECYGDPVFFVSDILDSSSDYSDEDHINFQWQESTNGGTTWTNLADGLITNGGSGVNGVNTDTLGVIETENRDSNLFRVLVWTDVCDTLTSASAYLFIEGPISFVNDPDNITECQGNNVSFSATTLNPGLGTISYQWERSCDDGATWTDISASVGGPNEYQDVTTTTLIVNDIDTTIHDCRFRLKGWTASCDTIYSNYAVMSVEGPIQFAAGGDPVESTVCSGDPACFSVTAENLNNFGLISYQWQIWPEGGAGWVNATNSSIINGATASTLCFGDAAGFDSTQVRCIIQTQYCAADTSAAALLIVEGPIAFTDHPDDVTQCSAENVLFVGAAAIPVGNSGSISYQWQTSSDGINYSDILAPGIAGYSGYATDSLTITNVAGLNGRHYRLAATSGVCAEVYSFDAVLTVEGPLSIVAQPSDVQNCDDAEALFTASINNGALAGAAEMEYQWEILMPSGSWDPLTSGLTYNGVNNFAGATNDTMLITPLTGLNGAYVRLKSWTSTCDTLTTDSALIAVEGPIVFTDQPDDVTTCSNTSTECFTIAITNTTGVGSVTYQWQYSVLSGVWSDLSNTAPYSGATTNQLCISNTTGLYNYKYRCAVMTGNCEAEYSDLAQLFVEGPISVDTQPVDTTVCSNKGVLIDTEVSLPAASSGALNLQWQMSANGGTTWSNLTNGQQTGFYSNYNGDIGTITGIYQGVTSEDLSISLVEGLNGYMYRMIIWTSTCQDTTDEITLTILDACSTGTCDFDLDGQINNVDTDDDNDQLADTWEDYLTANNVTDGWNYTDDTGGLLDYSNCDTDSDNDGLPDNQEDPDGDEINNGEETDGDGVFDGDPLDPCDPVLGPTCVGIQLGIKVKLQGAKIGTSYSDTLMRDDLRELSYIPRREPYDHGSMNGNEGVDDISTLNHTGDGGDSDTLSTNDYATVMSVTGPDAIVDWVFVEIRSSTALDSVKTTRAALLQRDGDVVDLDGVSPLGFTNAQAGAYYVAIRHRNHLGVMSAEAMDLSPILTEIDFTDPTTPTYGDYTQVSINGTTYMWAGDLNTDGRTIYQGPGNDVSTLFTKVITDDENLSSPSGPIANWIRTDYSNADVDLNGKSIYQGPLNDRAMLLFNTILIHPANVNQISNYVILETLP